MRTALFTVLQLAGLAAIVVGVWQMFWPAALIVGGVLAAAIAERQS